MGGLQVSDYAELSLTHQLFNDSNVIMSETEDVKLVKACLEGDTKAFGRLIDKYEKPLFNAALRIAGDYDDARDITQAAFISAYENLRDFNPEYKFFSWIYRMVVNEAINFANRKKSRTQLDPEMASDYKTPEDEHHENELCESVELAVAELPLDYRLVIIFRHWADLPYRDIGFVLDIPEKTVKSRLYSARRMLGKIMSRNGLVTYE
jgi:RNA polymerase sigma-70 factor (ECF subfamily)